MSAITVEAIPANDDGRVDLAALKAKLGPATRGGGHADQPQHLRPVRARVIEIAEAVHAAGAYFYCDGANFNAIVGRVRPGDLGVDAMHINLHKTFSTPHGGGGPGRGPGGAVGGAGAVRAGAVGREAGDRWRWSNTRASARRNRPLGRMKGLPRPDGHVRARAQPT
jgi:glycine dehydrogenase subunit 2